MICIIQARIGSARLKEKLVKKIGGHTIIEWVIKRAKKIKGVDLVVVVIPKSNEQIKLVKIVKKIKCEIFEGSEKNLVNRFYYALKKYNHKNFIRICADNPFICHKEIDHLVKFYKKNKYDYVYNYGPVNSSYPDGIGAEISNLITLSKIKKLAKSKSEQEHLFEIIKKYPKKFKKSSLEPKDKFFKKPFLKLDIDYQEQLSFFNKVNLKIDMSTKKIINQILKFNEN